MFNNIGKKLQVLALIVFILGVISSITVAGIAFFTGETKIGLLLSIGGPIYFWISTSSTYALGLVAENSEKQQALLEQMYIKLHALTHKSAAPVPIKSVTKNTTFPKASSKQEVIPNGQVRCLECSETFSATESRCPYCGYKR